MTVLVILLFGCLVAGSSLVKIKIKKALIKRGEIHV